MDRNLVQGPTSRFNRLRNWFNNLSRRVKIGSILTSFAALVAIVLSFAQLWQIMHPKKPPPPPINAELQKLGVDDELELTVSRIDYLRDTGKSTEGYSHKELQEFGLLVNTDADIEGLKDRELTLEYTLYNSSNDIRVPERSNKVADKIEPAASNDNERLTAFVPYPPEAGEYFTTLKLYDQNGVVLDELDSEPFTVFYAGPQPPEDPTVVLKKLYDTDNTSFLCSDCIPQTDNTQALAIDVPSEWRDVDGRGWSLQGESIIGPSFSASPNLDDFLETPNTPGVQFFASSVIANTWNYLDQYANESGSCQHEGRHNYNDGLYSGHYDVWENCGTRDTVVVNLLAWPQSETVSLYFTFVSVQVTGETDIEAANAIFNSFDVVGSLPSQSVSPSASASASATSTSSAAPGTTGITAPNNVGSSNQDRTSIEGPSTADLEAEAEEAVGDYYRAAGSGDWTYTYNYLDSETQSKFTEVEWKNKNKCLADINTVTYQILSVDVNTPSREPVASVTLKLTYGDGSTATRSTLFVREDGVWKHRFTEEEINRFKPETSSEEFVADNKC